MPHLHWVHARLGDSVQSRRTGGSRIPVDQLRTCDGLQGHCEKSLGAVPRSPGRSVFPEGSSHGAGKQGQ